MAGLWASLPVIPIDPDGCLQVRPPEYPITITVPPPSVMPPASEEDE